MHDIIKSWDWRIRRVGYKNLGDFAKSIKISLPSLSRYINGSASPTVARYDLIEKAIVKLEKKMKV